MTDKAQALLITGGRISKTCAAQIVKYLAKFSAAGESLESLEDVLIIELPAGVRYELVEFDPEKVVDSLEIVEAPPARVPDGTAGIRDVDAPCDVYLPGEPGGFGADCFGDGHYICSECEHFNGGPEESES